MPKDRDIIKAFAKQAGVYDQIKDLSEDDDIPAEISNIIRDSLMTEKDAMSNSKIKNHHMNNFIQGIDIRLEDDLKKSGFSKEERDKVFAEGNFTDRVRSAISLIKEKGESSPDKDAIARLTKQVEEEREKVLQYQAKAKEEVLSIKEAFEAKELNSLKLQRATSFKWSDKYDEDERIILFESQLAKKLEEVNGVLRNEEGKLVVRDKNNLELFAQRNSKNVTFEEIENDIKSKYMAVSAPAAPATTQTQTGAGLPKPANALRNPFHQALDKSKRDQGLI